jgi:hypothetical protein
MRLLREVQLEMGSQTGHLGSDSLRILIKVSLGGEIGENRDSGGYGRLSQEMP